MQSYANVTAFTADADKHPHIGADFVMAALGITRRAVEVEDKTIRAHITTSRHVDITTEPDGSRSVWVVGAMIVGNKPVKAAVLTGHVRDATKVPGVLRGAATHIAEVMASGSRVAHALGEGREPSGVRVLFYHVDSIAPELAGDRFAAYVARNRIELPEAEKPVATKRAAKKAIGAAA